MCVCVCVCVCLQVIPSRGQSAVTVTLHPSLDPSSLDSRLSAYCLGYISLDQQVG